MNFPEEPGPFMQESTVIESLRPGQNDRRRVGSAVQHTVLSAGTVPLTR